MKLPTIVIFGRTNVGKSTLFNCLIEAKNALVSPLEGTTRDANISALEWRGQRFNLIDTGGFLDLKFLADKKAQAKTIDELVQKQARRYLTTSDIVLFLVDNTSGLLPADRQIAALLKKYLPQIDRIILVVNKVDGRKQSAEAAVFNKLNLGQPQLISATTGTGTGDLLDIIVEHKYFKKQIVLDKDADEPEIVKDQTIKVCLLGQTNVGKSSLLNAFAGYERVIVSPIANTTREPQDAIIEYKDHKIKFVDTAGISRHGQKMPGLEKQGILKSLIALRKADIALLVLDISQELTRQTARLVEEIFEAHKSLIIIANKWDLVDERDSKKFTKYVFSELPFATFAPIIFTSAKNREKISRVLNLILEINERRHLEISDLDLQDFLHAAIAHHLPTRGKGTRFPRLTNIHQTGSNPPRFSLNLGPKQDLDFSYVKFLQNRLREKFKLTGTPISIKIIKK